MECRAVADQPFDQVDAGDRARPCRPARPGRPGWNRTAPARAGRACAYSFRISATRSTSPVEEAKNATRLPASTSVRASAMATCMLPWNASEGRVAMCKWLPSASATQPISSSFNSICGQAAACALQILPVEVDLRRIVGRRARESVPAASRSVRPPRAPAPARPRPRSAAPAARIPTIVVGRSIGATSSHPGNGSPGAGRSRPGMPASRISSPSRTRSCRDFWYSVSGSSVQSSIFSTRPLRFHVEAADRLHLVAEQVDAHRLGRFRRKDVQNAAAHRVFAHHLDRFPALVADAFQVRDHFVERHFVAHPQLQGELPVEFRRLDAQQRRSHRQDRNRHPSGWPAATARWPAARRSRRAARGSAAG